MDYKLSPKKIEYDCTLLIPIQVDNIGIGLAIITSITCFDSKNKIDYNCVSNETSRTKVIKKSGSSTFYIEMQGLTDNYCNSSDSSESFSFKLVVRGMKGENYIIFIILLYFS